MNIIIGEVFLSPQHLGGGGSDPSIITTCVLIRIPEPPPSLFRGTSELGGLGLILAFQGRYQCVP